MNYVSVSLKIYLSILTLNLTSTLFRFIINFSEKIENRSWFARTFNTGGMNHNDPDNPSDNREHAGMVFFRDYIATIVNNPLMKAIILLIFAVYLAGAGYGITQIQEGLERRKLSPEDSYSVKFFDLEDEYYREFPYRMQVIVAGEINYWEPVNDSL